MMEDVEPAEAQLATFRRLVANTLVSGVTSSFLWFALTFWVYLETRSVVATGVIGGAFSISSAVLGPFFGTYVDRHRKHAAMVLATAISAACFVAATAVFLAVDAERPAAAAQPVVLAARRLHPARLGRRQDAGHRPVDLRDAARARGPAGPGQRHGRHRHRRLVRHHVGVQRPRHRHAGHGLGLLRVAGPDGRRPSSTCSTIHIDEPEPEPVAEGEATGHVDVRGALEAIHAVPGLMMLILLAAFNNLLGGVFMALMDAYGLSLVSVETWGFLFGFISLAFIVGGLGRGQVRASARNPLRVVLVGNLVNWMVCSLVHAAVVDRDADDRDGRVAAADPGDRGGRADRAAAVDPLRAPGPGLRLRPAGRERRRPAHRLPHGAARRDGVHAVHDRRVGAPTGSAAGSAPAPSGASP